MKQQKRKEAEDKVKIRRKGKGGGEALSVSTSASACERSFAPTINSSNYERSTTVITKHQHQDLYYILRIHYEHLLKIKNKISLDRS